MAFVSLDSPSCEVPCLILLSVVYRDVTRQAKGLYRLKHEVALKRGLAYLSRCNSSWFCHKDISMDFIVGLPNTSQKHDSIWVIIDRVTKTTHFLPVHTTYSARKYAEVYLDQIVRLHGVPKTIISDRGAQFIARF
jgi:hypothetical protein